jgi:hypothetical protein
LVWIFQGFEASEPPFRALTKKVRPFGLDLPGSAPESALLLNLAPPFPCRHAEFSVAGESTLKVRGPLTCYSRRVTFLTRARDSLGGPAAWPLGIMARRHGQYTGAPQHHVASRSPRPGRRKSTKTSPFATNHTPMSESNRAPKVTFGRLSGPEKNLLEGNLP